MVTHGDPVQRRRLVWAIRVKLPLQPEQLHRLLIVLLLPQLEKGKEKVHNLHLSKKILPAPTTAQN
jgi:hypothetical protein